MKLTHFNTQNRAKMVDVSEKNVTFRTARATGTIFMAEATLKQVRQGETPKGDVLAVAQVAGIMAAKRTAELIPMCHPLQLTGVDLRFTYGNDCIHIFSQVKCKGETGVEMEALTAVSVAALTIYDMCKAIQKDMRIENIRLLEKTGGKSGVYHAKEDSGWQGSQR